jgi:sarcosine oxidase, subunit gamma
MREPAESMAPQQARAIQIRTISDRTLLRLKSWSPEHVTGRTPAWLAGWELPSQVGLTLSEAMRILCTAPGEWLLVSQANHASGLREFIEADRLRQGMALVDLTSGLEVLGVGGPAVRQVLSKGCGLDFHPRRFPCGRCARTRFAQIPVLLDCIEELDRFELYVTRSHAQCLKDWLLDAAVEFVGATR